MLWPVLALVVAIGFALALSAGATAGLTGR
jgi:hypothetical protein